jgi:hypothetical protein
MPRAAILKRKEIITREQEGAAHALERCRVLVERIHAEVRDKEAPQAMDIEALAEFLVALERAALMLAKAVTAPSPDPPPPPLDSRKMSDNN